MLVLSMSTRVANPQFAAARPPLRPIGIALLVASICAWPSVAVALPIIDQSNVFPPRTPINDSINVSELAPVGQEFVPQLDRLDSVEVLTEHGSEISTFARIREGSIQGPVLGTSTVTTIDGLSTIFRFGSTIELIPGALYVIEVAGQGSVLWDNRDLYGPGRAITLGHPADALDLWFREGLGIPEPATAALIGIGLAVLARGGRKRRDRRRS